MVVDDGDGVAGAVVVHDVGDVLHIVDRMAVEFDDEIAADEDFVVAVIDALIAALDSGAGGGRVGNDLHDQHAGVGGQIELLGQFAVHGHGQGTDAEGGTADASELNEVAEHGLGGVDGDGEADAGVSAAGR